jgi:N-succinyl-L-ornithine transcarbamylase
MRNFTSVNDVENIPALIADALALKKNPFSFSHLGKNKTLGLIFLNPSLRTRLSTQKAAANLGMNVMIVNMDKEGWALETQDGIIMNHNTVEHIKEAAAVMGQYCDIIGIRSFPKLIDREEDYSEDFFHKFIKYAKVPVISLESATLHPLQSFADVLTIEELKRTGATFKSGRPKVVLTWAPHIKSLPQAVANSFAEWMVNADVDFIITHPHGYDLDKKFTKRTPIVYDQEEALQDADFIYVKNWSSYTDYGKVLSVDNSWMITNKKLELTHHAKVMHCLPVRRGIELADEVLDGDSSLVIQQAANRVWSCQAVIKKLLEDNF